MKEGVEAPRREASQQQLVSSASPGHSLGREARTDGLGEAKRQAEKQAATLASLARPG